MHKKKKKKKRLCYEKHKIHLCRECSMYFKLYINSCNTIYYKKICMYNVVWFMKLKKKKKR